MPIKRRALVKDEYSIFETLAVKGVAVAPFATSVSGVGAVDIPAVLVVRREDKSFNRTMITKYGDIVPAIAHAVRTSPQFFMQKYITGYEVACGVIMDKRKIIPLVPVDAIPRNLHESGAWHVHPRMADAAQVLAKAAHKAVGAKQYSCVRLVVENDMPYVTSVDVAPALSRTGLFMRSAALAGFTEEEIKKLKL